VTRYGQSHAVSIWQLQDTCQTSSKPLSMQNVLSNSPNVDFLRSFVINRSSFAFPTLSKHFFREFSSFSDGAWVAFIEDVHNLVGDRQSSILKPASPRQLKSHKYDGNTRTEYFPVKCPPTPSASGNPTKDPMLPCSGQRDQQTLARSSGSCPGVELCRRSRVPRTSRYSWTR
jgi:hypothetical protein